MSRLDQARRLNALAILYERYARGDIDDEQYRTRRDLLNT
jgi:uncharacterized membrane protein